MNSQPTAFDTVNKNSQLYKIVRKSFRVPVDDSDKVWVKIDNIQYPVQDICLGGVGITLENPTEFSIAQTIMNCELNIAGMSISGLKGRVIHFSLNSGKDWQCGIQWIDMDKESAKKLSDIVSELKNNLLNDDHQTG
jgi:c-di-GMP-binding flagellar brake protein YcgR